TLTLPSGDYRLRVTGEGRLSRVYRCAVNRGESATHWLSLDADRLLGEGTVSPTAAVGDAPRRRPIPFVADTVAMELTPGKADLLEMSPTTVCRRDGQTGRVIWDAMATGQPARPVHPWVAWFVVNRTPGLRPVEPPPDVDRDGMRDLVWAAGPSFLALSGR